MPVRQRDPQPPGTGATAEISRRSLSRSSAPAGTKDSMAADDNDPNPANDASTDDASTDDASTDDASTDDASTDGPAAVGLRAEAERHLRALAGPDARLREDQWTAISALVTGRRRALVVQRTGWGKSAVYFTATALLRARGAGPSVIVSPLLALMRNQIEAADRAG